MKSYKILENVKTGKFYVYQKRVDIQIMFAMLALIAALSVGSRLYILKAFDRGLTLLNTIAIGLTTVCGSACATIAIKDGWQKETDTFTSREQAEVYITEMIKRQTIAKSWLKVQKEANRKQNFKEVYRIQENKDGSWQELTKSE